MITTLIKTFKEFKLSPCSDFKDFKDLDFREMFRTLKLIFEQRWIWWTDRLGIIKNEKRVNALIELGCPSYEAHDSFGYDWYSNDYIESFVQCFFCYNFYYEVEEQRYIDDLLESRYE